MKPFGVDDKPWVIVAMDDFLPIAQSLVAARLGTICTGCSFKKFPDGTPDISLAAHDVEGRDVLFIGSPEPGRYLEFFSIVYSIPRYFARSLLVILPYFPTGTMERVEREGEVATAKTLIRMMSAAPPGQTQTTYLMFDIHALATRFFFSDCVKVLLPSVIHDVPFREVFTSNFIVCFPDLGAAKRFSFPFSQCGYKRTVTCSKIRGPGNSRQVVLQDGNEAVRGAHVLVVDDLVQSGSTLAACRDALYAAGAGSVAAFVVHAVFPRQSWKHFLTDENGMEPSKRKGFTHFFVTDTQPWTITNLEGKRPYRVLPIAPSLIRILTTGHAAKANTTSLGVDAKL
ncbi:phosphoribosyl pyrophosphate synthetase, putative [Bodo saltans]|uniref:Phosphoribosyl pyrophosphate synthetase, putative n=1 Tax=Bodo saltans TaxID=75058 RepID=A0A0S4ILS7_BODSA|nr:phosphoribosyl pyrophosphate synthetase, putative [Bodo saltans]|eukprot:CUE71951.1 phosphoribosyl pyrophosphate synthetase, putative [Bodo saltans]